MTLGYPGSLHSHTEYSNLRLRDSINRASELIDYAIELGHQVIAITEHETISNAIGVEEYYNKIKKNHPDFKVILGNEIYLCRDGLNNDNFIKSEDNYFHFILLAKNARGHEQIRELSTRAWMRSYVTGKMRRVPTYYQDLIDIVKSEPGNIVGSTACLGGFLATKLIQWRTMSNDILFTEAKEKFYEQILNWLKAMSGIFGEGNFYLEMQPSYNEEQVFVNKEILKISKALNIPYIITTDSHYRSKEDASIHEAFLNSQDGDREVASFYETTYHMSDEEIRSYFEYLSEEELQNAYSAILDIKAKCEDYSLLKPLKIPSLKWKPAKRQYEYATYQWYFNKMPNLKTFYNSDFDGDRHMVDLIIDKFEDDERLRVDEMFAEINENLDATWVSSNVNKAHWSAYYLNLQNILDVCWKAGSLVGPGRGSGVGFALLYILDLIQINPLWETTRTFGWRFLNPERASVLDIDTDIEGGKRAQVLQALRKEYGEDRVANVVTFGTETSKSAIQTAARGLGVDIDIALYISSLIPSDRGKIRTLSQCYYGDEENGFEPISLFVQQMTLYPEVWEVARRIEGLISKVGEHAGGVIFVDEPFTKSTALMKVPNGDTVTQFDLHTSEKVSLIKIDLLSVECLDKIHTCLDLLASQGYIERQPTLKETYYKYLDIYKLERNAPEMWQLVWEHKIQSLFQMEKQSGIQGIALTKPQSVDDLAVLNSVIRLMAQDKDEEQPLVKYARFKNDINQWYAEMTRYGLTKEEQEMLKPIVGLAYGICESQEKFMQLVRLPAVGGFGLSWADRLRKAIAKKNPKDYDELTKEFFENAKEKNLSQNLCNYVWNVLVATSRGYGFNASHTLAYSLVALQEMNLAYKYPIIFWNCACLITDSGGADNEEDEEDLNFEEDNEEEVIEKKKKNKSKNYDKIATAIGKMRSEGINITPPDINQSSYTFIPDAENNRILFGLRGIINVGDDIINNTISNRPYASPRDYLLKVKPNKQAMISLIKAGTFDNMMDRKLCLGWYIWETCDKKSKLTLQNMNGLIKYKLLPEDTEEQITARRIYEFNRYLKAVCKFDTQFYILDERAINFLMELEYLDLIIPKEEKYYLEIKSWEKIYQKWMDIFRTWLSSEKDIVLEKMNQIIFLEDWNKYAKKNNLSSWEMESLCFYYHEHELNSINQDRYGLSDFYGLPEAPEVDKVFRKAGRDINIFKLHRICGTCIAKNKDKGMVSLLTTTGVVEVKFRKEYFSMFDKQISVKNPDGTKTVMEKSWFNRGSMIIVTGIRSGDSFVAKKYASTPGHTLYQIEEILEDNSLRLRTERYQGGEEEDSND